MYINTSNLTGGINSTSPWAVSKKIYNTSLNQFYEPIPSDFLATVYSAP